MYEGRTVLVQYSLINLPPIVQFTLYVFSELFLLFQFYSFELYLGQLIPRFLGVLFIGFIMSMGQPGRHTDCYSPTDTTNNDILALHGFHTKKIVRRDIVDPLAYGNEIITS